MNSLNSFKGYGKVDPVEDSAFRRTTRKRLLIIFISVLLLLFLLVGVSIALFLRHSRSSPSSTSSPSSPTPLSNAIKAVCSLTLHPDSCVSTLSSSNSSDPQDLFDLSLHAALSSLPDHLSKWVVLSASANDSRLRGALEICGENIRDSADILNSSLSMLRDHDKVLKESAAVADLRTYLSAVLTNLDTCVEGFEGDLREKVTAMLGNSTELASNSLAIVTHLSQLVKQLGVPVHRKLLAAPMMEEEPWWVGRVLLQEGEEKEKEKVDVTVAQDGSGDVKTIGEALAKVPKKSEGAFMIRVKAGKYLEVVRVEKYMWNVVMVGDGKGKSVVTGSRNYADGIPTFNTASFVVEGKGFRARGMTFENTAGPEGDQAVAARVKADQVVFFQCSFLAYQDTLYTHSFRQFYRDCDIVGTIDFIFGDASAVFQNCRIMPRQPGPRQQNMLTAQGRSDPNENTGFSIQSSKVAPYGSVDAPTFLGRPWRPYSTVVYMTSEIGGVVDPKGWTSWNRKSDPPSTTFYGEYMNTGSGAGTAERLRWEGYKEALSEAKAQMFSVGSFIQGDHWLTNSGIPYKLNV